MNPAPTAWLVAMAEVFFAQAHNASEQGDAPRAASLCRLAVDLLTLAG